MVNIGFAQPSSFRTAVSREWRQLVQSSGSLTFTAALMLSAFVICCAGIVLDARTITGVPAWLKPAKFAISSAIFAGSIAWVFRYLTVWPRLLRVTGWVLSFVLILEVAIIDVQAVRGTTSHFNVSTTGDQVLFGIMGTAIGILWLASVVVLLALFRQHFADGEWGWWLKLAMLLTVIGSASGGLMVRMTAEQSRSLHAGNRPTVIGGHTVGAPDGGPGLPGTGWSKEHGDLRIPHFLGLHGLQVLPLLGWYLRRTRRRANTALPFTAAGSYLAFTAILTWQALRGQSIAAPDQTTLAALGIWAAASLAVFYTTHRTTEAPAELLQAIR